MPGRRLAIPLIVSLASIVVGGAAALAAPPSSTLSGSASGGTTPDSANFSTITVTATLAAGVPRGMLETSGRSGGSGDDSHYTFSGAVTCMLVRGNRVIVGASGTSAYHEQREGGETVVPLPGPYVQVAVVEFVEPHEEEGPGGPFLVADYFNSLGEHHQGLPSTRRPDCAANAGLEAFPFGTPIDTLALSPSITRPADGFVSSSGAVALAGKGQPYSYIRVHEVAHGGQLKTVYVGPTGAWSATFTGLAPGSHEFVAVAAEGGSPPSNTVRVVVD